MTAAAARRRRRKVLYITVSLEVGGTERQLQELATRLDRTRFEPVVCCIAAAGPLADDLRKAGIVVRSIGFRKPDTRNPIGLMRNVIDTCVRAVRLVRFVASERADVVQTFLLWPCIVGVPAARIARVPLVLSSRRSLNHVRHPARRFAFLQRLVNTTTHAIIANSEAVKRDVVERERVSPGRIAVIRNGIDTAAFAAAEPLSRSALGVNDDAPVVGVIANLLPYKGHVHFLEAWQHVIGLHPTATALLIGEGPLRGPLESLVAAQSLPSIKFLGTRSDVAALLTTVDVVVHPSSEEGSANAVLEAMAASRPVVATSVGGNAEAIVNGETGFLVPPHDPRALADAINWLIEHRDAARAFGAAGQQRVRSQYGVESMVAAYEALYESGALSAPVYPPG